MYIWTGTHFDKNMKSFNCFEMHSTNNSVDGNDYNTKSIFDV